MPRRTWRRAKTPIDDTLHDVVLGSVGSYAVGDDGHILKRDEEGQRWGTIVKNGPTGNGSTLRAAATTDDEATLWVVGASGAIGEYDVETGELESRTIPGNEETYTDIAVRGPAGHETLYVTDTSGAIHSTIGYGADREWDRIEPGSGDELSTIGFHGGTGYAADTDGVVFRSVDGSSWTTAIDNGDVPFYALTFDAAGTVWVAGDEDVYHPGEDRWVVEQAADDTLYDITLAQDELVAVSSGGDAVVRVDEEWEARALPQDEPMMAVAADGERTVVVGESGTILEA
ncbi:WD40/YVTN/BNR-like repeat-containing protein [Halospeciosus flavus]|uniref:WD40/YVTN/BNR-like repeat-containing protein n=1 Tax=Halospeciosus flavus TaxID=3032283 RepID=A0ABD5Z6P1_9EURY|nr:hypothetical protein [Halospeciosus flavus]